MQANTKEWIQYGTASLMIVSGVVLTFISFFLKGDVTDGVLWYMAQALIYEGNLVWLSSENQFNYKAAYDLAVQTEGATLPVKFKFGTDEQPVYRVFENLTDLTDFYTGAMRFIQNTLDAGWQKKDSFNLAQYQIE